MAGSAEILKAYVSLNADTTGLRADLNKASADVEAWKRKTQVTVPLYTPGAGAPGMPGAPSRPGATPSVIPATPIVQPVPASFTESLKRGTAGIRGFSGAVQGALGVGLRFAGWVSLVGAAIVGLGRLFTEGERRVIASNKAYNDHAEGLRRFRESTNELTDAERIRVTVSDQLRETLKKIDADESLLAQHRIELARQARDAAREVQASMERMSRRGELTKVQENFEGAAEAFERLTASPESAAQKLTKPFDDLTDSIQKSITAAMQADSTLVAEYEQLLERIKAARSKAVSDMAREQREALVGSLRDATHAILQGMRAAQAEQASASAALAAETSRAISGVFSDLQRSIQSVNLQNIEGRLESIGQQVHLLARR